MRNGQPGLLDHLLAMIQDPFYSVQQLIELEYVAPLPRRGEVVCSTEIGAEPPRIRRP